MLTEKTSNNAKVLNNKSFDDFLLKNIWGKNDLLNANLIIEKY